MVDEARGNLAVVIPTTGSRPAFLERCLGSVIQTDAKLVVVVSPSGEIPLEESRVAKGSQTITQLIETKDNGGGAAGAINDGLSYVLARGDFEFVAWIGDDDTLDPQGIAQSIEALRSVGTSAVASVGACNFVDSENLVIYKANPSKVDVDLLELKGNKLPQPGSIFRTAALSAIGLLDTNLKYAFDQDLFHRLKHVGKILTIQSTVATFTWHQDSLSYTGSKLAIEESFLLRLRYSHPLLRGFVRIHKIIVDLSHRLGLVRLRSK
jgi:hypothetical protein